MHPSGSGKGIRPLLLSGSQPPDPFPGGDRTGLQGSRVQSGEPLFQQGNLCVPGRRQAGRPDSLRGYRGAAPDHRKGRILPGLLQPAPEHGDASGGMPGERDAVLYLYPVCLCKSAPGAA